MPDTSGGRDRAEMLERFSSELKGVARGGGVFKFPNYKFLTVNIRPPKWPTSKSSRFWIGRLGSFEVAQRVADGVFYYVGKPPFHFKDAVVTYPPLTCIGTVIGTPEVLSNQEMCSRYVRLIAKGAEYEPQRKDFIQQVEIVTRRLGDQDTFLVPPEDDGDYVDDGDREVDAPLEFDEYSAKALEMSSSGGSAPVFPTRVSHVARSDSLHHFVPSFEINPNDSGNILRSAGQSLYDRLNTVSEDKKKFRSGNETIEDLSKSSAAQTSTIVSNAGEIHPSQCWDDCPNCTDDEFQIWNETIEYLDGLSVTSDAGRELCESFSPILNIPSTVCLCDSPLSKTMLVSVASVERASVLLVSARGNSEVRLAMNAKRQKIGG